MLAFIGLKMIAEYAAGRLGGEGEPWTIPSWASLLIVASLLAISMLASIARGNEEG